MNTALIDLHSLVTIWAPDLSIECRIFLQRKFPLFMRQAATAPSEPDIVFSPLRGQVSASLAERYTQAIYGFCICHLHGEAAIGLLHRGAPDILIVPSNPIQVLYRPRRGVTRRLYGLLLFAIQLCLRRKGALMAHGTVVARKGQALLISGHQGTRKSQMLLTFIHHGWDYLSDDKFILYRGTAYLFESRIYVNEHQYSRLPWLQKALPRSLPQRLAGLLRTSLRALTYRYLPGRMPSRLLRLLDPARQYEIADLAPDSESCMHAKPSNAFVLVNGPRFATERISRQDAVSSLTCINQLLFRGATSMEQLLDLYAGSNCKPLPLVLERNFPDIPFYRVTSSDHGSLEDVYKAILTCCEAQ